ncbi:MAG: single-stranded DNA-binding protein [Candidatus Aegiribacteria sp.]|nr:single-stranded DNA-binding protein [Candidatus Aegiribacteria sp.]
MAVSHETPELNYIVLTGRMMDKGELKTSSYGSFVLRFSIENSLSYSVGSSEEGKKTYVISVEAWGNLAERIDRSITNDTFVLLEGSLVSRSYEDRSKGLHYRMIVKATDVMALGSGS